MNHRCSSRRKVLASLAYVCFFLLLYEKHEEDTKHPSLTMDRLALISLLPVSSSFSFLLPLPSLSLFLFSSVSLSSSSSSLSSLSIPSTSIFPSSSPPPQSSSSSSSLYTSSSSPSSYSSSSLSFSPSFFSPLLPSSSSTFQSSSFLDSQLVKELTAAALGPTPLHASSFTSPAAASSPLLLLNRTTATAADTPYNSSPSTDESAASIFIREESENATSPSIDTTAAATAARTATAAAARTATAATTATVAGIATASTEEEVEGKTEEGEREDKEEGKVVVEEEEEEDKSEEERREEDEKEEKEEGKASIAVENKNSSSGVSMHEKISGVASSSLPLSSSFPSSNSDPLFLPTPALQSAAAAKDAAIPSNEEFSPSLGRFSPRVAGNINEGRLKNMENRNSNGEISVTLSKEGGGEEDHSRRKQEYSNSMKNQHSTGGGYPGHHFSGSQSYSNSDKIQGALQNRNTRSTKQRPSHLSDAVTQHSRVWQSDNRDRSVQQQKGYYHLPRDVQNASDSSISSCTSSRPCGNAEDRRTTNNRKESRIYSRNAEKAGDVDASEDCGSSCNNTRKESVWRQHEQSMGRGRDQKRDSTDSNHISTRREDEDAIRISSKQNNSGQVGIQAGHDGRRNSISFDSEEGRTTKGTALWRNRQSSITGDRHHHLQRRDREGYTRLEEHSNRSKGDKEGKSSSSNLSNILERRHRSNSTGLPVEDINNNLPVSTEDAFARRNVYQQPLSFLADIGRDSTRDREDKSVMKEGEEKAQDKEQDDASLHDDDDDDEKGGRIEISDHLISDGGRRISHTTTPHINEKKVLNTPAIATSSPGSNRITPVNILSSNNSTSESIADAKSDGPVGTRNISPKRVLPPFSSSSSSSINRSSSIAASTSSIPSSSALSSSMPSSSSSSPTSSSPLPSSSSSSCVQSSSSPSSVVPSSPSLPSLSSTSSVRPSSSSSSVLSSSSSSSSSASPSSSSLRAPSSSKISASQTSSIPTSHNDTNTERNKTAGPSSSSSWIEEWRWVWLILISISLVIIAGIASGLTTGLMAFDELQLLVVQQTGMESQKQQAEAVCDLMRRNRHQLLVTLLLCNALAMEALPLFLDRLVSPVLAVLVSVSAILFVGEILPQALCTGRYQLAIAANLAPFVRLLLILLWPAAYPISRLLDYWLAERDRPSLYARAHLKALIGLHERDRAQPLLLQHRMETHKASRKQTASRRGQSPEKTVDKVEAQEFVTVHSDHTPSRRRRGNYLGGSKNNKTAATAAGAGAPAGDVRPIDGIAGPVHAAAGTEVTANERTAGAAPIREAPTGEAGEVMVYGRGEAGRSELVGTTMVVLKASNRQQREKCGESRNSNAGEDTLQNKRWEEAAGSGEQDSLAAITRMGGEKNTRSTEHGELHMEEEDREDLQHAVGLHRDEVLIMQGVRVADLMRGRTFRRLCTPLFVAPTINPYQLLNEFQEGRCHLAFVTRHVAAYQRCWEGNTSVPAGAELLGIVTLEDVIEELIQEEIMDEFDRRFRADSCSSIPFVEKPSSTSLCLKALQHSSSYASGQATQPGEFCSALPPRRGHTHRLAQELRQSADVARIGGVEGGGSEVERLRSSRTHSAALNRFASLLLTKNQEAELREDMPHVVNQGRSATSILASSQLGSRASLLFASAPDIECGRAFDGVAWGDVHALSPCLTHARRRLQQQDFHDRPRRKTAYFPMSKNFAATYRPAANRRTPTTQPSVLAGSSMGTSPQLAEVLLSTSPSFSALNRQQLVPEKKFTTTTDVDDAASPGRSRSAPYAKEAQHLRLRDVPFRAIRSAHEGA